jgi:hypothetical protein
MSQRLIHGAVLRKESDFRDRTANSLHVSQLVGLGERVVAILKRRRYRSFLFTQKIERGEKRATWRKTALDAAAQKF